MQRFDFDTEFETSEGTIYVHAKGRITDYIPATFYRKNGDPGDPAEGGEIEYDDVTAYNENDKEIDFPDELFDELDNIAATCAEDDGEPDYCDYEED